MCDPCFDDGGVAAFAGVFSDASSHPAGFGLISAFNTASWDATTSPTKVVNPKQDSAKLPVPSNAMRMGISTTIKKPQNTYR